MHDKLHRSLVEAVVRAVIEIFTENRYADKVIELTLSSDPRMGSRDRAFVADTVYSVVRWWRLVGFMAGVDDNDVSETAIRRRVTVWFQGSNYRIPEWLEQYKTHEKVLDNRRYDMEKNPAISASVPDWMYQMGVDQLGEDQWQLELECLNDRADLFIRVNTLKTTKNELKKRLEKHGLYCAVIPDAPDCIKVERKGSLFNLPEFREGLFEVQDVGSQAIAPYLQVEPGMRVIDACAGAGGKTLHLAALMQGKGRIIAMDVESYKLDELKRRARRNNVQTIETKLIDDSKVIKRLANSADRLLMDAPCSGIGVLRRNPDAKWKLQPEFIDTIRKTQADILQNYPIMLKPGGLMVYATCSLLPAENEQQVQNFLANNPNFELLNQQTIRPVEGDGFYMALIKKISA